MEGMVAFGGTLYLFSKNWTSPYTGYTKLYKLPDTAGIYVAQLVDSFYTGPGPVTGYSVTGADISDDFKRVILISTGRCWLFTNFTGDQFFSGSVSQANIGGGFSLKEGVSFIGNNDLYITDETGQPGSGNLYRLSLAPLLTGLQPPAGMPHRLCTAWPVPFYEKLLVSMGGEKPGAVAIEIVNATGQTVLRQAGQKQAAEFRAIIDTGALCDGIYFILVTLNGELTGRMKAIRLGRQH